MSFQITISGHSSNPHNQAVQDAVDAALETLEDVEGLTATVSGYSNDSEGQVTLTGGLPRAAKAEEGDGA